MQKRNRFDWRRRRLSVLLTTLLLSLGLAYESPRVQAELLVEEEEPVEAVVPVPILPDSSGVPARADRIEQCIQNLLAEIGKPDTMGTTSLPSLYRKGSVSQDEEFLEYLFSIIYVESGFNGKAISPMEAYGLMQMTRIAVTDAVKHCNLKPISDMARLHDSVTNVKYGSCFLKKMLDEVDGDWTRALILYNGGYAALKRYESGKNVPEETAQYVLKVNKVLKETCRSSK